MNEQIAAHDSGRGMLLGIPIGCKSLAALTEEALAAIDHKRAAIVFACANAHSMVVAQEDQEFMRAFHDAHQVVADGVGAVMMARVTGAHIGPRITGMDYFSSLMRNLDARGGGRVFFFGSSDHVLDLIVRRMAREFPTLVLCGVLSPPFRAWTDEENNRFIEAINAARPDVLWVGMTAPKQEKWVNRNRHRIHAPVIGSVGAVFDFYAGTLRRAPQWIRKVGLEWLYRLYCEPRRMWRRQLISPPKFVFLVLYRRMLDALR